MGKLASAPIRVERPETVMFRMAREKTSTLDRRVPDAGNGLKPKKRKPKLGLAYFGSGLRQRQERRSFRVASTGDGPVSPKNVLKGENNPKKKGLGRGYHQGRR